MTLTLTSLLILLVFMLGIYFYAQCYNPKYIDGFTNQDKKPRCPNMLIQKGSRFYLYNSKLAQVPGVNPIEFDNLEDYTEFLDWQRSQGIRCPVLYLQYTFDAQGNPVYKVRPSVSEPQAGLPPSQPGISGSPHPGINGSSPPVIDASSQPGIASSSGNTIYESSLGTPDSLAYPNPTLLVDATKNDPPYNKNSYPAYDQSSYYVGTTTPLDNMNTQQQKSSVSANPMDSNWGGSSYTQGLVDKGYYKDNEVKISIN
jgi:hypothetical protein